MRAKPTNVREKACLIIAAARLNRSASAARDSPIIVLDRSSSYPVECQEVPYTPERAVKNIRVLRVVLELVVVSTTIVSRVAATQNKTKKLPPFVFLIII